MGDTSIEWTQKSWNPVRGTTGRHICQRISPGCKNCYAAAINRRFSGIDYVAGADVPRLDAKALTEPFRWRNAERCFVCSMTDLFWDAIPDEFIDRVFAVMALCTATVFQVLTKRADRMHAYMTTPDRKRTIAATVMGLSNLLAVQAGTGEARIKLDHFSACFKGSGPFPNVHLGVSVENQAAADERIPELLATPAAVRFLSVEPLLGPVSFTDYDWTVKDYLRGTETCQSSVRPLPGKIDWIIVGGESGPGARPCDLAWIRSVVQQAKAAGVPCFVKQLGAVPMMAEWEWQSAGDSGAVPMLSALNHDRVPPGYVPIAVTDRKGGDWTAWPSLFEDLRVREFPR